mgnify:CR=1 FL=1
MKKDYILITSGEAGGIGIDLIITMMLNYYTNTKALTRKIKHEIYCN